MSEMTYPELIENLPDVDLDMPGVRAKLLQGVDNQLVFFEIEPIGAIPPHAHGAQWGVVIEGELELTISGETRTYQPGDSYFIPAGSTHEARVKTRVRAVDVFDEVDRYRPKK